MRGVCSLGKEPDVVPAAFAWPPSSFRTPNEISPIGFCRGRRSKDSDGFLLAAEIAHRQTERFAGARCSLGAARPRVCIVTFRDGRLHGVCGIEASPWRHMSPTSFPGKASPHATERPLIRAAIRPVSGPPNPYFRAPMGSTDKVNRDARVSTLEMIDRRNVWTARRPPSSPQLRRCTDSAL